MVWMENEKYVQGDNGSYCLGPSVPDTVKLTKLFILIYVVKNDFLLITSFYCEF